MPDPGAAGAVPFAELATACAAGDVATVSAYLEGGGRPTRCDDDGETLLHYAARAGQSTIVRVLLRAGADSEAVNAAGETFRDVAAPGLDEDAAAGMAADGAVVLPELTGDRLVFTFDVERERSVGTYVVRHDGAELFRLPVAFDDAAPFEVAARRLVGRYGAAVHDVVPSGAAERALFGESSAAARRVEAARDALRTGLAGGGAGVLAAVIADPDADEPRIEFARWLERARRGDRDAEARAELVRLQLPWVRWEGAGNRPSPPNPYRRQHELLEEWGERWARQVAPLVRSYRFHRGFVEEVELDAASFLEHHAELYAVAPIRHLRLVEVGARLDEVARSPALRRIRSLAITSQAVGDEGVRLLASSPHLTGLRWLDLSRTGAGFDALDALAASPFLRSLLYLGWDGNLCETPSPEVYSDWDGSTAHWQETTVGLRLRERHGDVRWTQLVSGVRWPPRPGDL